MELLLACEVKTFLHHYAFRDDFFRIDNGPTKLRNGRFSGQEAGIWLRLSMRQKDVFAFLPFPTTGLACHVWCTAQ